MESSAIIVWKCLAQGQKCHDWNSSWDSNQHSAEQKHQSLSLVILSTSWLGHNTPRRYPFPTGLREAIILKCPVTTGTQAWTRTHTLLNRNTRAWVLRSYPLSHDTSQRYPCTIGWREANSQVSCHGTHQCHNRNSTWDLNPHPAEQKHQSSSSGWSYPLGHDTPQRYPFTTRWREAIIVNCLAHRDTSVKTVTRTHTLLNRNTRAQVQWSYSLGHTTPKNLWQLAEIERPS